MTDLNQALLDDKPVFAYFSASWCEPCRIARPTIENFEQSRNDINFIYIDIDSNMSLVEKHSVVAVPTIITFKNGAEVERTTGVKTSYDLNALADNITKLSPSTRK